MGFTFLEYIPIRRIVQLWRTANYRVVICKSLSDHVGETEYGVFAIILYGHGVGP